MRINRRIHRLATAVLTVVGAFALYSAPANAELVRQSLFAFGPSGTSGGSPVGSFSQPDTVAVDEGSGDVYVYDAGQGAIYKFNADGEPANFSSSGTNVIAEAGSKNGNAENQIAVDNSTSVAKGDIYLADAKQVSIYSSSGENLGTLHPEGSEPCGVAVDTEGNVYVGVYPSNIAKYKPTTNNPIVEGDLAGTISNAEFPCNVAPDNEGGVYFASYFSGLIIRYPAAKFIEPELPGSTVEPGKTFGVDPANNRVLIDELSQIHEYDAEGRSLMEFGAGLSESYGVAVNGSTGRVYVGVDGEHAVDVFGPIVAEVPPTASILPASHLLHTQALLAGTVNPQHVASAYHFVYGPTSSYGTRTPDDHEAGSGATDVSVSEVVTGLTPGATYHYALVAENREGATTSEDATFTMPAAHPPILTTGNATAITHATANLSGSVDPNGLPTTYRFEYGTTTAYGTAVAGDGGSASGAQSVTEALQGLAYASVYHYRLVAINADGTTEGEDRSFTTLPFPEVFGVPAPAPFINAPAIAFPKAGGVIHKKTTTHRKHRAKKHPKHKKHKKHKKKK